MHCRSEDHRSVLDDCLIVRNYGYMVYDTLLAVDDKLQIKPQMLEGWKVSDDKLAYTFTLRDGLKFQTVSR